MSVSALSGAKRFRLSLYISPATDNNRSEDTLVGGTDRYLSARFNAAIMIVEKNWTKN